MADTRDPLPYYRWYPRHHRANRAVQALSWEHEGLLRSLLDEQWEEGCIPDDVPRLAEIARCPVGVMAEAWLKLRRFFEPLSGLDGMFLVNPRLERERTAADAVRVKRSIAGKQGGAAKSKQDNASQANAKQMLASAKQMPYSREEQRKAENGQMPTKCPLCSMDGRHSAACPLGRLVEEVESER